MGDYSLLSTHQMLATLLDKREDLHEERAMRLMYELRAMPPKAPPLYIRDPLPAGKGWVPVGGWTTWGST